MKITVIIPAYNEETELPQCLKSTHTAIGLLKAKHRRNAISFELIVVDNNSTDATAMLAREGGAQVVFEPINQISRARNAGAREATGDWLLFIDADSRLSAETLEGMLQEIESGNCAGGGSLIGLEPVPYWGRFGVAGWNLVSRITKCAAGSFIFCRAEAFAAVGGFNEDVFAGEELYLSLQMKRWAKNHRQRFTILTKQRHVSSGRKFFLYSKREIFALFLRCVFFYPSTVRKRSALDFFYEGRR